MEGPPQILDEMEAIEKALAEAELEWAEAERTQVRLRARHDLREAQMRLSLRGSGTVKDIDAAINAALWEEGALMQDLISAEADTIAFRTRFRVLDRRLSSLQTRLNALQRSG